MSQISFDGLEKKAIPIEKDAYYLTFNYTRTLEEIYDIPTQVGSVADALKMSAKDVYHRMSKGGIISDYIVPCYDVLHTFSREYIVEDLVDLMKKKGVLKVA